MKWVYQINAVKEHYSTYLSRDTYGIHGHFQVHDGPIRISFYMLGIRQ